MLLCKGTNSLSRRVWSNGRMIVDWPDKMGFVEESIQPIDRNSSLPERWDRVGGKGGENFTTLPHNGIPYT